MIGAGVSGRGAFERLERVDECRTHPNQPGFRMFRRHEVLDRRLLVPAHVDENQVFSGIDIAMVLGDGLIFRGEPGQPSDPGAEQGDEAEDGDIDQAAGIGAERLPYEDIGRHQQGHAETDHGAEFAIADHVVLEDEVRPVDVAPVQPGLVLADDVEVPVGDARRVDIVGDLLGAVQIARQIVHALHG
jgi:hypothetical protein